MKPFWRATPLTPPEEQLLAALDTAHAASAARSNPSTVALFNSYGGSASYTQAVASALLTLGGPHAPLAQTQRLLAIDNPVGVAERMRASGQRVPGWGSSFSQGILDPLWLPVSDLLFEYFFPQWSVLHHITDMFLRAGKTVYPNPSAYTATTAIILGLPPELAPWLFIRARLDAWTALLHQPATRNTQ